VIYDALDGDKDRIRDFHSLSWKEQKELIEGLSDGHSANTLGSAYRLAYWLAVNPDNVVLEHGALTPLVGCKDYGCTHD